MYIQDSPQVSRLSDLANFHKTFSSPRPQTDCCLHHTGTENNIVYKQLLQVPLFLQVGSYPGFRNWVPKIGDCKMFGCTLFPGRPQYTQISTINMHLLIEIRHTILMGFILGWNNLIICLTFETKHQLQQIMSPYQVLKLLILSSKYYLNSLKVTDVLPWFVYEMWEIWWNDVGKKHS